MKNWSNILNSSDTAEVQTDGTPASYRFQELLWFSSKRIIVSLKLCQSSNTAVINSNFILEENKRRWNLSLPVCCLKIHYQNRPIQKCNFTCMLFYTDVRESLWNWGGGSINWRWWRTRCWGEFLDLRPKARGDWRNYTVKSSITCTLHRLLLLR